MKPMYVFDKLNRDKKEVAAINYVEGWALLWTNSAGTGKSNNKKMVRSN